MFRLLASGDWQEGRVRTVDVPSTWQSNPAVDAQIDRAWWKALQAPGVHLFDGPMCRLERFTASTDVLTLEISQTSYRIFVGTQLGGRAADTSAAYRANPVGVSTGLISSDGMLLLGLRSDAVAYYPKKLHPFAGTIDPQDRSNAFDAVRRELREELSLGSESVRSIRCVALVEDQHLIQPELVFIANADVPARQIAQQVDPAEHTRVWSIPADGHAIDKAVGESSGEFTPIALATLLLIGREVAGDDWFASRRAQFTSRPPSS
jgi:hypothetical protein